MKTIFVLAAFIITGCGPHEADPPRLPRLAEVWYYHPTFVDQGAVLSDWWIDITRMEEIDGKLLIAGRRVNYWNLNGTLLNPTPRILFPDENPTFNQETKLYEGMYKYLRWDDLSDLYNIALEKRRPNKADEKAVIARCELAVQGLPVDAAQVAEYVRAVTSSITK
jgi:hypothetical protein